MGKVDDGKGCYLSFFHHPSFLEVFLIRFHPIGIQSAAVAAMAISRSCIHGTECRINCAVGHRKSPAVALRAFASCLHIGPMLFLSFRFPIRHRIKQSHDHHLNLFFLSLHQNWVFIPIRFLKQNSFKRKVF